MKSTVFVDSSRILKKNLNDFIQIYQTQGNAVNPRVESIYEFLKSV